MWLQSAYKVPTKWLQSDYKVTTKWLQSDYKVTTKWLQSDYKVTTKWLQSDYKVTTKWLQIREYAQHTIALFRPIRSLYFTSIAIHILAWMDTYVFIDKL